MKINPFRVLMMGALALVLHACAAPLANIAPDGRSGPASSKADPPVIVKYEQVVEDALACFANTPFANLNIIVGPTFDNTAKASHNEGGTGAFLPQGGVAPGIKSGLFKTGADIRLYDRTNTSQNVAMIGSDKAVTYMGQQFYIDHNTRILESSYDTLDFTGEQEVNFFVGPVGPVYKQQGALISVSVDVLMPGTQSLIANSEMAVYVNYASVGINVAAAPGNVRLTGLASFADQQAIQLTASRLPLRLAMLHAISQLPETPQVCRDNARALLDRKTLD